MFAAVAAYFHIRARSERESIVDRIRRMGRPAEHAGTDEAKKSPLGHFFALAHSLGHLTKPKNEDEITQVEKMFATAGLRRKNMVIIFFGSKIVLAILLAGAFFLAQLMLMPGRLSSLHLLCLCIVFSGIGFYLPGLWLRLRVAKRKEEITLAFPEALDLLVVAAEAGMGLDAALNRVGEEMKLNSKAISEEFKLLNLELRAGKSRRDAMKNLALRTDLDDVSNLVTLLVQTDRFGTSVAQSLRVHADSMRTKRVMKVEEMAAKLPVKILFPTILFIFPSLFLVIMGPALIQAYHMWTR
jgi:tight adherence protein C